MRTTASMSATLGTAGLTYFNLTRGAISTFTPGVGAIYAGAIAFVAVEIFRRIAFAYYEYDTDHPVRPANYGRVSLLSLPFGLMLTLRATRDMGLLTGIHGAAFVGTVALCYLMLHCLWETEKKHSEKVAEINEALSSPLEGLLYLVDPSVKKSENGLGFTFLALPPNGGGDQKTHFYVYPIPTDRIGPHAVPTNVAKLENLVQAKKIHIDGIPLEKAAPLSEQPTNPIATIWNPVIQSFYTGLNSLCAALKEPDEKDRQQFNVDITGGYKKYHVGDFATKMIQGFADNVEGYRESILDKYLQYAFLDPSSVFAGFVPPAGCGIETTRSPLMSINLFVNDKEEIQVNRFYKVTFTFPGDGETISSLLCYSEIYQNDRELTSHFMIAPVL
jgi:hypothetical protein